MLLRGRNFYLLPILGIFFLSVQTPVVAASVGTTDSLVKDHRLHAVEMPRNVVAYPEEKERLLNFLRPLIKKQPDSQILSKSVLSLLIKVRLSEGYVVRVSNFADVDRIARIIKTNREVFHKIEKRYLGSLSLVFRNLLNSSGQFKHAISEDSADIVVAIDLADSLKASGGEEFKSIAAFPERSAGQRLNETEFIKTSYILPWTVVTTYRKDVPSSPVLGGDVWIRYPIRTYLQELETFSGCIKKFINSSKCRAQEIESSAPTEQDIKDYRRLFVYPHKTPYFPFSTNVEHPRASMLAKKLKEGGAAAFNKIYKGNSLSDRIILHMEAAAGRRVDDSVKPRPVAFPSLLSLDWYACSSREHNKILSARLVRALVPFSDGYAGMSPVSNHETF